MKTMVQDEDMVFENKIDAQNLGNPWVIGDIYNLTIASEGLNQLKRGAHHVESMVETKW